MKEVFIPNEGFLEKRSYQEIVKEASFLKNNIELAKLKIAQLAIEACAIRHGGRSVGFYTLTDFSTDTGINYKKIAEWTLAYRVVVSKIPEEIKSEKDWNKAVKISESLGRARAVRNRQSGLKNTRALIKKDLELGRKEILILFNKKEETRSQLLSCEDGLNRSIFNIKKIETFSRDDEFLVLEINRLVNIFIEKAEEIRDISIKLINENKR